MLLTSLLYHVPCKGMELEETYSTINKRYNQSFDDVFGYLDKFASASSDNELRVNIYTDENNPLRNANAEGIVDHLEMAEDKWRDSSVKHMYCSAYNEKLDRSEDVDCWIQHNLKFANTALSPVHLRNFFNTVLTQTLVARPKDEFADAEFNPNDRFVREGSLSKSPNFSPLEIATAIDSLKEDIMTSFDTGSQVVMKDIVAKGKDIGYIAQNVSDAMTGQINGTKLSFQDIVQNNIQSSLHDISGSTTNLLQDALLRHSKDLSDQFQQSKSLNMLRHTISSGVTRVSALTDVYPLNTMVTSSGYINTSKQTMATNKRYRSDIRSDRSDGINDAYEKTLKKMGSGTFGIIGREDTSDFEDRMTTDLSTIASLSSKFVTYIQMYRNEVYKKENSQKEQMYTWYQYTNETVDAQIAAKQREWIAQKQDDKSDFCSEVDALAANPQMEIDFVTQGIELCGYGSLKGFISHET